VLLDRSCLTAVTELIIKKRFYLDTFQLTVVMVAHPGGLSLV